MTFLMLAIYASAIVCANLLAAHFGPSVTPYTAFALIGLDFAVRDVLHERISKPRMLGLIVASCAVSFALNPTAGAIAQASAVSFLLSGIVDWAVFSMVGGSWLRRSHASNIAGAAVDSVVFPLLAFGAFMPHIVAAQFLTKTAGGALWSSVFAAFKWADDSRAGGR